MQITSLINNLGVLQAFKETHPNLYNTLIKPNALFKILNGNNLIQRKFYIDLKGKLQPLIDAHILYENAYSKEVKLTQNGHRLLRIYKELEQKLEVTYVK